MSSSGTTNYEYVVARVRHRRASLFAEDDYRKLTRMGPGGIARFMEETEYKDEINALGARYSGVQLIEYALNRNLAKHFEDLLRWSEGRLYDLVARYLRKFDAWNLKTILRGHYSGASAEEIRENLIDAGEFDDAFLDQLVAEETVDAVLEHLEGTLFEEALDVATDDFEETGLLTPLENAIDRAYFEALIEDVSGDSRAMDLYQEFLQAEIDFKNIQNSLRIARSGADMEPSHYFIEGGRLFDPSELRSLAENRDQLVSRIRESRYGDQLSDALEAIGEAESLISFERALDDALLSYSEHLSYVYPLSICPVLAYILAKEREVDNILAIAHGKEAGLSEAEIEAELVML